MDPATHLAHLRADASALLAAAVADPDAAVPACPGWDRRTVLQHLCVPYGWAIAQAEAGPDDKRGFRDAVRPGEDDDLFEFFERAAARVVEVLGAMDVAATWPTFAGPRPGAWFPRRMAVETAIHRHDAAGGAIDPVLAVDGVDELLEELAPLLPPDRFAGTGSTLHLHATDVDTGEWLVTLGPERVTSERVHAKGDAAVRAAASDLFLFAWNRVPLDDRFEVIGDRAAAERWSTTIVI
ncbi:MAG TPA: maleylpyruvate isomerase N-terminal domain-containing protein [Acidimicrobiales bacterium]|nr:maleylpyruvate isomerase N-terminal domain-containing protein [Acidimicrobiales bacterium]